MSVQLTVLKASFGDSIVISGFFDGSNRNILIDGGPGDTFQQGIRPGELKEHLEKIKSRGEKVDLLIITHEDQDHICGIISAFEEKGYLSELTSEVWFNSGKLLAEKLSIAEQDDKHRISTSSSSVTSILDGITLERYLKLKNIKHEQIVHSSQKLGNKLTRFGCDFEILSPSIKKLKSRNRKWEEKYPNSLTSSSRNNTKLSLLMNSKSTASDPSPSNGASIAFNFKYKDKSIMLLGDAHATEVVRGLKSHGYSKNNKIKVDYVKLSHHGSKNNTSKKMLNLIDCDSYIITTDGSRHGHPDKEVFARIIECTDRRPHFLFNHPHLINQVFVDDDHAEYDFVAKGINTVTL
ncbi:TPA: MBL fold metallo-hydrolase [Vibrio parahaemolyticus]|uniref:ComEC/Rec2 family competence protein n=2 Tax=Vibrio parahaemolyticus TaxID=670 RepID=UPI00112378B4|nr:MBL fold metallo-hydrolase [Vibrio parahaemolyticus]MCX8854975.1 MBL fold metallo-hydrolase [Vibrio parahaemolyticus]TOI74232.1 MBL fold metallo-hydrolase [Vibrio parahaemolyticus]HCE3378996.1 MBL fold metallo-hydrolase [Vibrio parahaemolyticus]HCG8756095.1 MBL fold metallo-hydrolase [Vibrio parahaemolyticus]HCH0941769.1 MBL fold metallo-hydrolase [Vibrio parahaemolyticus]